MKISPQLKAYMQAHPFCEACGKPVRKGALPHHIKTRGAGGTDDPENLLRLCDECHYVIVHALPGIRGLIVLYTHLRAKVLRMKPKLEAIVLDGELPIP